MKTKLAVALATLSVTSGAFAADLGYKKPTAVPVMAAINWTGFYVGAQVGYQANPFKSEVNAVAVTPFNESSGSFIGGLHAGYNRQYGRFVVGAEVDAELNSMDKTYLNFAGATFGSDLKVRWQGSLRARVGYTFERVMIYATGGLALAEFGFSGGPAAGPLQTYTSTRAGFAVGVGAEYAFTRNLSARIEYRYTDFGARNRDLGPLYAGTVERNTIAAHAVRAGVSYKF